MTEYTNRAKEAEEEFEEFKPFAEKIEVATELAEGSFVNEFGEVVHIDKSKRED